MSTTAAALALADVTAAAAVEAAMVTAAASTGTRQELTDGGCVPHDPALYAYAHCCLAAADDFFASHNNDDDAIVETLVQQYHRDGFLVVHDLASVTTLANRESSMATSTNTTSTTAYSTAAALDAAITDLTTGANRAFRDAVVSVAASGRTPNFCAGAKIPWVQYEAGTNVTCDGQRESQLLTPTMAHAVRKLMGFVGYNQVIDSVVNDSKLLTLVARLLDCEHADQVELFQDMALLKPAGGREKPWHQDKAYFDIALHEPVVGCWMAIDEADVHNGCLRFQKGGHRSGPRMHYAVRDYQICDTEFLNSTRRQSHNDNNNNEKIDNDDDIVVAIPLPPGGFVLFDGMIPHGTPTNTSNRSRRALQFHWIRRGARIVPEMERTQIFGGAPNGLSC